MRAASLVVRWQPAVPRLTVFVLASLCPDDRLRYTLVEELKYSNYGRLAQEAPASGDPMDDGADSQATQEVPDNRGLKLNDEELPLLPRWGLMISATHRTDWMKRCVLVAARLTVARRWARDSQCSRAGLLRCGALRCDTTGTGQRRRCRSSPLVRRSPSSRR